MTARSRDLRGIPDKCLIAAAIAVVLNLQQPGSFFSVSCDSANRSLSLSAQCSCYNLFYIYKRFGNVFWIRIQKMERYLSVNSPELFFGHHIPNSAVVDARHDDSAATLVHAFVTSRVDYCNAFLAAAPKTTTGHRQDTTSVECCRPSRQ